MKLSAKTRIYISNSFIYKFLKTIVYYFFIKDVLENKLKNNVEIIENSNRTRILIPLIETSHYEYYHLLFLAEALRLRGVDVKVLVCDSTLLGCELKSVRSGLNPCFSCCFNLKNIVPKFNVDIVTISEFVTHADIEGIKKYADKILDEDQLLTLDSIDITTIVNDSVDRYFYGASESYSDNRVKAVKRDHIVSSLIGIKAADKIYSTWNPHSILSNMDAYSAWSPYHIIADKYTIKYNVIMLTEFDIYKKILNMSEIYLSNKRYKKWISSRSDFFLIDKEKKELDGFLTTRFSGMDNVFKENKYFSDNSSLDQLSINPKKTNIFVFSNIYWDVGMSEFGDVYSGIIEWVLDTVEILKNNKDICLYIKPHPGEEYSFSPSNKTVVDFIIEKFGSIPTNMTVIRPDMKIKSYDLFPFIDIGVVFNGTIGLEMLLNNIPVISTGMAPYSFLDSVSRPDSREQYVEFLLGNKQVSKPHTEEVRLFSYFYFIKALIPWVLTPQARGGGIGEASFSSLKEIQPGKNKHLDHLCNCIIDEKITVEDW